MRPSFPICSSVKWLNNTRVYKFFPLCSLLASVKWLNNTHMCTNSSLFARYWLVWSGSTIYIPGIVYKFLLQLGGLFVLARLSSWSWTDGPLRSPQWGLLWEAAQDIQPVDACIYLHVHVVFVWQPNPKPSPNLSCSGSSFVSSPKAS